MKSFLRKRDALRTLWAFSKMQSQIFERIEENFEPEEADGEHAGAQCLLLHNMMHDTRWIARAIPASAQC